jgi:hypothetical protein
MITEPSIYPDLDDAIYHSACTPTPALSAGFAWKLDRTSPARAWYDSVLNPAYVPEEKTAFDIGEAAHLLFLEPERFERKTLIIDADDYRTKAAQASREEARANRLVPLLVKQRDMLMDMRRALFNELDHLPFKTAPVFARNGIADGTPEQSYFWIDRVTGIWCKARPDYVRQFSKDRDVIVDYKTAAQWQGIDRYAIDLGWHSRAAFYVDGHTVLTGRPADYWYVVQSKDAPYFVTVAKVDERALHWGRQINQRAARVFAECLEANHWPTGIEEAQVIMLPAYAEMQLNDRLDNGDFTPRAAQKGRKTDAEKRADAKLSLEIAHYFAP